MKINVEKINLETEMETLYDKHSKERIGSMYKEYIIEGKGGGLKITTLRHYCVLPKFAENSTFDSEGFVINSFGGNGTCKYIVTRESTNI